MRQWFFKCLAIGAAFFMPALAQAAEGYATANVNMRAGPSTDFPAITVIPDGRGVEIHGCLSDTPWCDVSYAGNRGWVSGNYVQAIYQERRVRVEPDYYTRLGIPSVVFSIGSYWNNHYRNRSFYQDRDRWSRGQNGDFKQKPIVRPREETRKPTPAIKPSPSINQPTIGKNHPNSVNKQPVAGNTRPNKDIKRPANGNARPNTEHKQPAAGNHLPNAGNKKPQAVNKQNVPGKNRPAAANNNRPGSKPGAKIVCRPGDQRCQQ